MKRKKGRKKKERIIPNRWTGLLQRQLMSATRQCLIWAVNPNWSQTDMDLKYKVCLTDICHTSKHCRR